MDEVPSLHTTVYYHVVPAFDEVLTMRYLILAWGTFPQVVLMRYLRSTTYLEVPHQWVSTAWREYWQISLAYLGGQVNGTAVEVKWNGKPWIWNVHCTYRTRGLTRCGNEMWVGGRLMLAVYYYSCLHVRKNNGCVLWYCWTGRHWSFSMSIILSVYMWRFMCQVQLWGSNPLNLLSMLSDRNQVVVWSGAGFDWLQMVCGESVITF